MSRPAAGAARAANDDRHELLPDVADLVARDVPFVVLGTGKRQVLITGDDELVGAVFAMLGSPPWLKP